MKLFYTLLINLLLFSSGAFAQTTWNENFEAATASTNNGNPNNYEGAGFIRRTSPVIAGTASMVSGTTVPGFNQFFLSGWFSLDGTESIGYQHRMQNNVLFTVSPGSLILRVTLVPWNGGNEILVDSFNYASVANMTTVRTRANVSLKNLTGVYRLRWRVTQIGGNNANSRAIIDNINSTIQVNSSGRTAFLANTKVEISNGNKDIYEFQEEFSETITFTNQGPNTLDSAVFSLPSNGMELLSFSTEGGSGISYNVLNQRVVLRQIPVNTSRILKMNYKASQQGEFTSAASKQFQHNTLDPNSADDSFSRSFSVNGPLPVVMLFFKAFPTANGVELNWATAAEMNSHYFQIERFNNSTKNFEAIGKIFSAGNSNKTLHYQYIDSNAKDEIVNYRLKQLDKDGQFEYFSASVVQQVNAIDFKIYPNPAVHHLNIVSGFSLSNAFIQVLNLKGEIQNIPHIEVADDNAMLWVENLKSGTYIVQIQANGISKAFKFTKN